MVAATVGDCDILVCWYGRKYSISHENTNTLFGFEKYLFTWLHQVSAAAWGIFSCGVAWTGAYCNYECGVLATGLRQEVEGSPHGKAIGNSFPEGQNSKTRIAGQLREEAGPSSDHIFLIPEVWRPPWPLVRRKAPWRSKGEQPLRMLWKESVSRSVISDCLQPHGLFMGFLRQEYWSG